MAKQWAAGERICQVPGDAAAGLTMATGIEVVTASLALCGLAYMVLALLGARAYVLAVRRQSAKPGFAPGVSVLKPLHGTEPGMYGALASHCRQAYAGEYELVFGVSRLEDLAAAEVERLRTEFPEVAIRLVECPERLGTSGKVSNLVQMLPSAKYEYVLINDADIRVADGYLTGVMRYFSDAGVGMVTAPYLGCVARDGTVWSRLEALGISTDFLPGVLAARLLEGGIRFGLGSTLAVSKVALTAAGGFESLLEMLADDYELGRRVAAAGFRVELCGERVETGVPRYGFSGFWEHQLRWARSTRDSRKLGYLGLGVTYCVPWALMTVAASGAALWSFSLLATVLFVRVAVALTVGVGVLRDRQVLRDLWLVPVRDCFGLLFWAWSYAGDTVVWRGEEFRLSRGRIAPVASTRKSKVQ